MVLRRFGFAISCAIGVMLLFVACTNATAQSLSTQLDELMQNIMHQHGVNGASLSVSKGGRLVYSKGFGYANVDEKTLVSRKSLFRIASVSKPITAVAILHLVDQKRLKLSDRPYKLLGELHLPPNTKINPDIYAITIEDLLRHTSGQSFYNTSGRISSPMQPPLSRVIAKQYNATHPPTFEQVIGYAATQPLMAKPATTYRYSNYGYALLGAVIEKITGQSYESYVKQTILKPMSIHTMALGKTRFTQRLTHEVTYYDLAHAGPVRSVFKDEPPAPYPYAGRHQEGWGASGAWVASTDDVVKFMNHIDGLKRPAVLSAQAVSSLTAYQPLTERKRGFWYGLGLRIQQKRTGQHWYHDGSSNIGAATLMVRSVEGVVWCASFNQRLPAGRALYKAFNRDMWKIIKETQSWPHGDLFYRP